MTTIQHDLGMTEVRHTWYEPTPGTLAHRIRQSVRWTLAGLGCASPAIALLVGDWLGSI